MASHRTGVLERIRAARVVGIVRRVDAVDATVAAVRQGGIDLVEITLDTPRALDAIRRHSGLLAGTVRLPRDVDAAVDANAAACVSPGFVPEVVERCHERAVPAIPGAFTPTEVEAAWRLGAAMVKLFPGSLGGPGYVRELLGPLADVPLLVPGGVTPDNAADYLRAGAVAVGAGSSLTRAVDIAPEARRLVAAVRAA